MSRDVEVIGPFRHHEVAVTGWRVPLLTANPQQDGVELILDDRYSVDIPADLVETVVPFVAECIAVALGYCGHPEGDEMPPRRLPDYAPMARLVDPSC